MCEIIGRVAQYNCRRIETMKLIAYPGVIRNPTAEQAVAVEPEGLRFDSPGQSDRPWGPERRPGLSGHYQPSPERAQHPCDPNVAPFQGFIHDMRQDPGRRFLSDDSSLCPGLSNLSLAGSTGHDKESLANSCSSRSWNESEPTKGKSSRGLI